MRSINVTALMVFVILALFSSAALAGEESTVKKSDIPEAVLKAFQASYPKVEATGYDKETKDEKTFYEIEAEQDELEWTYVYAEDGTLIQTEQEIKTTTLPEAVVKAVQQAHKGCEIEEAEKITRDSTVEYEIVIGMDEKDFELLVASDGKILSSHELMEEETGKAGEDEGSADEDDESDEEEDD